MGILQSIAAMVGSVGGFGAIVAFFKILAKFRRTPELNRHTAAQTDSMTATATRLLVEPLERVIAQKDDEINRVKDTSVRRLGLLRRLLHHHDDVIDSAVVAGARIDDLPAMPEDLREALDRELE